MRKILLGYAIVLIFICVIGYFLLVNNEKDIPLKKPQLISAEYSPSRSFNVYQGSTFQLFITFKSHLNSSLVFPLGEPTLIGYNSTDNTDYLPEGELFSHNFSVNPLFITPYGSNSTVLTVNVAIDAPIGKYLFEIEYGNSDITNYSGTRIIATVLPANK